MYYKPCKELDIDLGAPMIGRETIRKNLQCRIYPLGYPERYKYTVICTSYQEKWVLSRHKKRSTWETQGGHIPERIENLNVLISPPQTPYYIR